MQNSWWERAVDCLPSADVETAVSLMTFSLHGDDNISVGGNACSVTC